MSKIEKVLNHVGLGVVARTASRAAHQSPFEFDEDLGAWVRREESLASKDSGTDEPEVISEDQSELWLTW